MFITLPNCAQKFYTYAHGFLTCDRYAYEACWCPTWTTAEEGPVWLCEEHTQTFNPEFNIHASEGQFFWGDQAYEEFNNKKVKQ